MHALPAALAPLAAYRQFIVYIVIPHETKPGKTNKFPIDFRTGLVTAKGSGATDPAIWTDAQTAIAVAAQLNTQGGPYPYGVGFVFTLNDPFFFLDIDGAHDGNDWSQLAKDLCAAFPGAAIEVSHSGRGLHIFGAAQHVPPHKTKNAQFGLEFYHANRFVALTGTNAVGNASLDFTHILPRLVAQFFVPDAGDYGSSEWTTGPCPEWYGPTDDDKLIERAMRSQSSRAAFGNGASFADLWTANVEVLARAYPNDSAPYDASLADSALAQHLAFWTGKDCERIKRLMMRSALVREKWQRDDYMQMTITKVVARQMEVLTDKMPEPSRIPAPMSGGEMQASPLRSGGAPGEQAKPASVNGATFLTIEQQIELFKGCIYVCDQHRVLIPGGVLLRESQFRVMFGGYSFPMDYANERTVRDAWEAFTQSQAFRAPIADTAAFLPNHAPGSIVERPGRTIANTYWPVNTPRRVGDIGPFMRHLEKVIPNERDRRILLSYMAAIVQHKGIKFQWAPLIQGAEGNGKTLFTRCVAFAVGGRYSYFPSAADLADKFNDWMVGAIFIGVEDIYVSEARTEILEALKPMVTNSEQQIQGKGRDKYTGEVCCNWILNSNHKNAIQIKADMRRYSIFYSAQQTKDDINRCGMGGDYFPRLYNWLKNEGGYEIVNELLHTYPIDPEFNPAGMCQRAPETSSMPEAINASRGGVEQEIMEAIAQGSQGFGGDWISSIMLDRLLKDIGAQRRLPRNKRDELLLSLGYMPHPALSGGRAPATVMPDAGVPILYVRTNSPAAMIATPSEVVSAYSTAQSGPRYSHV
jgi:hypothetical protein